MRAANMQALTDDVKREWPGVIVYGIGDAAHKLHASGHNEDDTAGSRPELEDSDSRPEHRAIDIMIGAAFTKADADALVARLLADPRARARLYYIIWNGHQWSRSSGWVRRDRTDDPHRDHVHVSGWAADDENAAPWAAVEEDNVTREEFIGHMRAAVGDPAVRDVLRRAGWEFKPADHGDLTAHAIVINDVPAAIGQLAQLVDQLRARVEQLAGATGLDPAALADVLGEAVAERLAERLAE